MIFFSNDLKFVKLFFLNKNNKIINSLLLCLKIKPIIYYFIQIIKTNIHLFY